MAPKKVWSLVPSFVCKEGHLQNRKCFRLQNWWHQGHLIGNKESLTTSSTVSMIYDLAFPGTQKCQKLHAIEPICYFVLQHRIKCLLVLEGSQRETMFVKGWLPQVSMLCGFPPPGMNARKALLPWLIFCKRPMHSAIVWLRLPSNSLLL